MWISFKGADGFENLLQKNAFAVEPPRIINPRAMPIIQFRVKWLGFHAYCVY
jgi:hypothetical protein